MQVIYRSAAVVTITTSEIPCCQSGRRGTSSGSDVVVDGDCAIFLSGVGIREPCCENGACGQKECDADRSENEQSEAFLYVSFTVVSIGGGEEYEGRIGERRLKGEEEYRRGRTGKGRNMEWEGHGIS